MQIAIVTMVHNEAIFLPLWIRHYSKVPGAQLIVIDNGSDDDSTDNLPNNIEKITFPHKELIRDTMRIEAVSNMQNALIQYYDRVIYTDVDEFIIVDPNLEMDLAAFISSDKRNNIAPIGLNIAHRTKDEDRIDFDFPILRQRQFVFFSSSYCKPLITRDKIRWMPGFHGSTKIPWITSGIYLFHLRLVDLEFSLNRAAQRMTRTLKGQTWDQWGLAKHKIVDIFEYEGSKPLSPTEGNFDFSKLIAKSLDSIKCSPDKSQQRLGHVEGHFLHKTPERFLDEIDGLGNRTPK